MGLELMCEVSVCPFTVFLIFLHLFIYLRIYLRNLQSTVVIISYTPPAVTSKCLLLAHRLYRMPKNNSGVLVFHIYSLLNQRVGTF
jgi:hypothetical protein